MGGMSQYETRVLDLWDGGNSVASIVSATGLAKRTVKDVISRLGQKNGPDGAHAAMMARGSATLLARINASRGVAA